MTAYRGTVFDQPIVASGLRGEGAFTGRPARAGDVIVALCHDCASTGAVAAEAWPSTRASAMVPCVACTGTGRVQVRLTEDPAPLHKAAMIEHGDGWFHGTFDADDSTTIVGWLIVGTIISNTTEEQDHA